MTDEIEIALAEIVNARNAAALPLVFSSEATAAQNDRSSGQLRAALTVINGGWPTVRTGVTRTAGLVGTVAKAIAQFQNEAATEISVEQADLARGVAEQACKLTLTAALGKAPGVAEGFVCN